jgi:hypothetical protein
MGKKNSESLSLSQIPATCCVSFSVSDPDPDLIGSADPDPSRPKFSLKKEKEEELSCFCRGFKMTYKKVFDKKIQFLILKMFWSGSGSA